MPDPAAGGSSVQVVGLDEAFHDFRKWADQVGPAVEADASALAGRLASRVSSAVPHDTGALAASVGWDSLPGEASGFDLVMGGGLPYAPWIEFGGTRGRPAIPQGRYLGPTALSATDEFGNLAEATAESTARGFPWNQT